MVDMAMHMMDIAQNSIRGDAKNIHISFFEDCDSNILLFSIVDDGKGMSDEELSRLDDPFFTTRTTRKVGLGIPLLKMTCEQGGGSLSVQSKEGFGTTVEATYRTDNPDCLPLGDIAGYLTMLLVANPHVRIRFSYKINSEEFMLDNAELSEQGIELLQPGVAGLIKTFIKENLEELYSYRTVKDFLC